MIHGYLLQLKSLRTSLNLEDILDHHDLPDECQDDWSHHLQSRFTLRFPKIYDMLHLGVARVDGPRWKGLQAIKPSRTSTYLEDILDHPDLPDGCQDDWSHHH